MNTKLSEFSKELYLNKKSLDEIVNLSIQLSKIMNDLNPDLKIDIFEYVYLIYNFQLVFNRQQLLSSLNYSNLSYSDSLKTLHERKN